MEKTAIVVAAMLLAACAASRGWHKEGVTKEATEADLYTCRTQARAPIEPRLQGAAPAGVAQPQGAAFETMADREAARMNKEERAVAECMRGKGYSD